MNKSNIEWVAKGTRTITVIPNGSEKFIRITDISLCTEDSKDTFKITYDTITTPIKSN